MASVHGLPRALERLQGDRRKHAASGRPPRRRRLSEAGFLCGLLVVLSSRIPLPSRYCFSPPENFMGDHAPDALHDNQPLADLGRAFWYCGDDIMTAGAFLGDHHWDMRGEDPPVLGLVGVSIRNAGSSLLEGDWLGAAGELETAASGGGFYLEEENVLKILDILPDYEEVSPIWGLKQALARPSSCAALENLAERLQEAAERVAEEGVAKIHLDRAAESLLQVVDLLFEPGTVSVDGAVVKRGSDQVAILREVEAVRRESGADAGIALLRQLTLKYHPDQNPGRSPLAIPLGADMEAPNCSSRQQQRACIRGLKPERIVQGKTKFLQTSSMYRNFGRKQR
eukprot:TRINITY_DN33625_c0_g1_i1.p1 TRINITY_DN33625_c0_g1~~TRINITY_DN33625_c0_g1_i1.p1  ORF type:complete len:341 (-),score=54.37 TRINITY_DN33625_c0_g1_i1:8-1030(-)